jgi:phage-related protein
VVKANNELTIDTGEMTVMLDGQDATRYFGMDSEFFKLRPGENALVYTDSDAARDALMKILWKDRWL